jgi:hypothetical protein
LVLNNDVRMARYEQEDQFSNKMVSDIVDQLSNEQSIASGGGKASASAAVSKRPRGRPRKRVPQPSADTDLGTGPRTRNRGAGPLGTLGLLAAPAFTIFPVKPTQNKVRPTQLFIFQCSLLNLTQREGATEACDSPIARKKRKKDASDVRFPSKSDGSGKAARSSRSVFCLCRFLTNLTLSTLGEVKWGRKWCGSPLHLNFTTYIWL